MYYVCMIVPYSSHEEFSHIENMYFIGNSILINVSFDNCMDIHVCIYFISWKLSKFRNKIFQMVCAYGRRFSACPLNEEECINEG